MPNNSKIMITEKDKGFLLGNTFDSIDIVFAKLIAHKDTDRNVPELTEKALIKLESIYFGEGDLFHLKGDNNILVAKTAIQKIRDYLKNIEDKNLQIEAQIAMCCILELNRGLV